MSDLYCPFVSQNGSWTACCRERCRLWNAEVHTCEFRALTVDVSNISACLDNMLEIFDERLPKEP